MKEKTMPTIATRKDAFTNEKEEIKTDAPISAYLGVLIVIFGICLSFVMATALKAGRFIEYKVPLFLMETPIGIIFGTACLLFLAVLSGLSLQKASVGEESPKSVLTRSQKISYFFSVLATLFFTAYICAVLVHLLKTGQFLSESLYIVFLFACILVVHFKAGKSSLAHVFTTAAFILVVVITAFYSGIALAKIENKHIVSLNGEVFTLVSAQNNNYILVGFDARTDKSNGKIMLVPKQNNIMEQSVFFPIGVQKR